MKVAFGAALVFFGLNYALGVALQLGLRWHPRPLHHALYFLTCASTLGALALSLPRPAAGAFAALLAALLLVPRTKPGRLDHAALASLIGAGFLLTAWLFATRRLL